MTQPLSTSLQYTPRQPITSRLTADFIDTTSASAFPSVTFLATGSESSSVPAPEATYPIGNVAITRRGRRFDICISPQAVDDHTDSRNKYRAENPPEDHLHAVAVALVNIMPGKTYKDRFEAAREAGREWYVRRVGIRSTYRVEALEIAELRASARKIKALSEYERRRIKATATKRADLFMRGRRKGVPESRLWPWISQAWRDYRRLEVERFQLAVLRLAKVWFKAKNPDSQQKDSARKRLNTYLDTAPKLLRIRRALRKRYILKRPALRVATPKAKRMHERVRRWLDTHRVDPQARHAWTSAATSHKTEGMSKRSYTRHCDRAAEVDTAAIIGHSLHTAHALPREIARALRPSPEIQGGSRLDMESCQQWEREQEIDKDTKADLAQTYLSLLVALFRRQERYCKSFGGNLSLRASQDRSTKGTLHPHILWYCEKINGVDALREWGKRIADDWHELVAGKWDVNPEFTAEVSDDFSACGLESVSTRGCDVRPILDFQHAENTLNYVPAPNTKWIYGQQVRYRGWMHVPKANPERVERSLKDAVEFLSTLTKHRSPRHFAAVRYSVNHEQDVLDGWNRLVSYQLYQDAPNQGLLTRSSSGAYSLTVFGLSGTPSDYFSGQSPPPDPPSDPPATPVSAGQWGNHVQHPGQMRPRGHAIKPSRRDYLRYLKRVFGEGSREGARPC